MKNKVTTIRKAQGMTQMELATRAKVSRPYISKIESGKQQVISSIVMEKIANALKKNIGDIFFTNNVV